MLLRLSRAVKRTFRESYRSHSSLPTGTSYALHNAHKHLSNLLLLCEGENCCYLQYSIPFLATGGGLGYGTTYGALDNGLELDLGYFKTVQVDAKTNRLIIGGSVTIEDIILPLYKAGKEFRA